MRQFLLFLFLHIIVSLVIASSIKEWDNAFSHQKKTITILQKEQDIDAKIATLIEKLKQVNEQISDNEDLNFKINMYFSDHPIYPDSESLLERVERLQQEYMYMLLSKGMIFNEPLINEENENIEINESIPSLLDHFSKIEEDIVLPPLLIEVLDALEIKEVEEEKLDDVPHVIIVPREIADALEIIMDHPDEIPVIEEPLSISSISSEESIDESDDELEDEVADEPIREAPSILPKKPVKGPSVEKDRSPPVKKPEKTHKPKSDSVIRTKTPKQFIRHPFFPSKISKQNFHEIKRAFPFYENKNWVKNHKIKYLLSKDIVDVKSMLPATSLPISLLPASIKKYQINLNLDIKSGNIYPYLNSRVYAPIKGFERRTFSFEGKRMTVLIKKDEDKIHKNIIINFLHKFYDLMRNIFNDIYRYVKIIY